jgi:hypothetical protein
MNHLFLTVFVAVIFAWMVIEQWKRFNRWLDKLIQRQEDKRKKEEAEKSRAEKDRKRQEKLASMSPQMRAKFIELDATLDENERRMIRKEIERLCDEENQKNPPYHYPPEFPYPVQPGQAHEIQDQVRRFLLAEEDRLA